MPLRCVIVDDSPALLRAASELLESEGVGVVGVVATGEEAIRATRELRPDVMLVDIHLGRESGFDLVRRLAYTWGNDGPHTILISTYDEADFASLIAKSPAIGFLPKSELSAKAIEQLMAEVDDAEGGELARA
jgi:DNA-binding NarL/FixJ family response regulator